jgi:hypothetical protein
MSTEIAVKKESPFNSEEFNFLPESERKQLAVLAKSGLFPELKDVYQAVAKLQMGKGLGISPVEAMRGIIINSKNGKASFTAQLIASLIQKYKGEDGLTKYDFTYEEDEKDYTARFTAFKRVDGQWKQIGKLSWGPKNAAMAGLNTQDTYKKYPGDMYFARGISALGRRFFAEVFGGNHIYTHDEVQDTSKLVYDADTDEWLETTATVKSPQAKNVVPVVKQVLTKETKVDTITEQQEEELRDLIAETGSSLTTWLNIYGKSSIEDLTTANFSDMLQKLKQAKDVSPVK